MKIMKPVFLCVAGIATGLLFAEDLTIGIGESVTVSENATYDKLTVNGKLSVAEEVSLSVSELIVGDGASARSAELVIGRNAQVSVTSSGKTRLGNAGGRATVTLKEASSLRAAGVLYFGYGYDAAPADADASSTEAYLYAEKDSQIVCGTIFTFGEGCKPTNTQLDEVKQVVRLDAGALLSAYQISDKSYTSKAIRFNGGTVLARASNTTYEGVIVGNNATKNTTLYLDSVEGHSIRFNVEGSERSDFAFVKPKAAKNFVRVRGAGDFVKLGSSVLPFVYNGGNTSLKKNEPNLYLQNEGRFIIEEGGFSVGLSNLFYEDTADIYRSVDLVLKNGTILDLAGAQEVCFNSILASGSGILTNSSETVSQVTVGTRGTQDSTIARVCPRIAFVKNTSGRLLLCGAAIDSLDVQAGEIIFLDRAHMGYPFYRYQLDGHNAGFVSTQRVYINELQFLYCGRDVTKPYAELLQNKNGTSEVTDADLLFDGEMGEGHWYYDQRATDSSKIARVGVTLEYDSCRPIDSYRWAARGVKQQEYDPCSWRILGGFSADSLTEVLDSVTGFTSDQDYGDHWVPTNFVCRYASATCRVSNMKIGADAKIAVEGATLVCDTIAEGGTGLELTLAAGAVLPLSGNQSVKKISVDLNEGISQISVLNPEATGALYVNGPEKAERGILFRVGSCVNENNLHNWAVYVNGELTDQKPIVLDDGSVVLQKRGLLVIFK